VSHGGVRVRAFGGAVADAFVWRQHGETRLSVVIKVGLRLVADGVAEIAAGRAELHHSDVHWDGHPGRSVRAPSDLVPALERPEVLLTGRACSPAGPAPALSVRLYVGGDTGVLDKTLHVYGERADGDPRPRPFAWMPLVYERAVGGPGTDNPVGMGERAGPNVVDTSDPRRPAGFGPLGAAWPGRTRRVVSRPPGMIGALLDLPDDLPLSYFQSAPDDQLVERIEGDEWIVVDGMHPELSRFQSQLPSLRARARLSGSSTGDVELRIDRLQVDMEELFAYVSWRGSVPVTPDALKQLDVMAGVEPTAEDEASHETMMLSEDQLEAALGAPLPFVGADVPSSRAPVPQRLPGLPFGAPPAPVVQEMPARSFDFATEHTVTADSLPVGFPSPVVPRLIDPADDDDEDSFSGTLVGSVRLPVPDLPFAGATAPSIPRVSQDDDDEDSYSGTLVAPISRVTRALPFEPAPPSRPPVDASPPSRPVSAPVSEHPPFSVPPASAAAPPPSAAPPASAAPTVAATPGNDADVTSAVASVLRKTVTDKVRAGEALYGMDLGSADLRGLDLTGAVFSDANLSGAKLSGAVLASARMVGTKLIGADLSGADLRGADLERADLARANLAGALLDGASLVGAGLVSAIANRARFAGARLDRASLVGGSFIEAVFDAASLIDADLSGAKLADTSFRAAKLSRAKLIDVDGEGATFAEASLDEATLSGAVLRAGDLVALNAPRSRWERAALDGGRFSGAKLREASFERANVVGCSFDGADLARSSFSQATADDADFSDADLSGADLRQAKLSDASLARANLADVNAQKIVALRVRIDGANLARASFRSARMKAADLTGARVDATDMRDADLEGAKMLGVDRTRAKLAGANLKGVEA
jgi:uncharacterized protein YjbI with pentapeptide repeats